MNIKDMPYANCFYSKDNKQWNKIPFLLPHRPLKERINKTNVEPKQDNYNPNNPNTNIVSAHVRIIGKYIFFVLNVPVCIYAHLHQCYVSCLTLQKKPQLPLHDWIIPCTKKILEHIKNAKILPKKKHCLLMHQERKKKLNFRR